jgi:hypothetical protein
MEKILTPTVTATPTTTRWSRISLY